MGVRSLTTTLAKLRTHPLVSIPFYGDAIHAVQLPDGGVFVSLKRLCEALGIDFRTQRSKLHTPDYDWATVVLITTVAQDGKPRKVTMIDLESVPMWLITIQVSRVAFDLRE